MTDKPIRAGFIGLNPGVHWAATDIPALEALPNEFEVFGVANTSLASARMAADAFGLPYAFENAQALIKSDRRIPTLAPHPRIPTTRSR